jgi:Cft2 family RNA processing exonuclease
MTHPTKAIYKMLLSDYVKVRYTLHSISTSSKFTTSNIAIEEMLYDEQDLMKTMAIIEPIDYHQVFIHSPTPLTHIN